MLPSTDTTVSALPTSAISGFDHAAQALAVYASQAPSPTHHARLASRRGPTLPGRDFTRRDPPRSFSITLCHASPPPRLGLAQGVLAVPTHAAILAQPYDKTGDPLVH